jgi:hypothetical protein
MARGWHGDSNGHAKAGRLGGQKSAQVRKQRAEQFGEKLDANENKSTRDQKSRTKRAST